MILAADLLSVIASISLGPAVVLVEQAASVCAQTHPRGRGEISSLAMISANSHVAAHKASICSLQRCSIQFQLDSLKGFLHRLLWPENQKLFWKPKSAMTL